MSAGAPDNLDRPASPAPVAQEVEWQFDADDLDRVASWLASPPAQLRVALEPVGERRIRDLYLDTADFRFFRAGTALRIRAAGTAEATLKALSRSESGPQRRRETSEPLPSPDMEALLAARGSVAERVRAVAGGKELRPIAEVATHRRLWQVYLDGLPAGEVALDETDLGRGPGRDPARIRRVEVEVSDPEAEAGLGPFAAALERICGGHGASRLSKFEAALQARGVEPPAPPEEPRPPGPGRTPGEVARAYLALCAERLSHGEPALRLGEDPKAADESMRAARHARAALEVFADALPKTAREIAGSLGARLDAVERSEATRIALAALSSAGRPDASITGRGDGSPAADVETIATILQARCTAERRELLRLEEPHRVLARARMPQGPDAGDSGEPDKFQAPLRRIGARHRKLVKAARRWLRVASRKHRAAERRLRRLHARCDRLLCAIEAYRGVFGIEAREVLEVLDRLDRDLCRRESAGAARERLHEVSLSAPAEASARVEAAAEALARRCRRLDRRIARACRRLEGGRWKRLHRRMADRNET